MLRNLDTPERAHSPCCLLAPTRLVDVLSLSRHRPHISQAWSRCLPVGLLPAIFEIDEHPRQRSSGTINITGTLEYVVAITLSIPTQQLSPRNSVLQYVSRTPYRIQRYTSLRYLGTVYLGKGALLPKCHSDQPETFIRPQRPSVSPANATLW